MPTSPEDSAAQSATAVNDALAAIDTTSVALDLGEQPDGSPAIGM